MKRNKKNFYRLLLYILGLFFLALGVAFSVNSNLGISPINSLSYVLSAVSGISMGTCTTMIFGFFILLQIIILRREFKPKNLLQVLSAAMFGYFVDLAKLIVGDFTIPTYVGQLLMLAISIVFLAIGITLYINVDISPMPSEGIILAIASKQKRFAFHQIKVIMDCVSVLLATLIGLIAFHALIGVREGTIIAALVNGKAIEIVAKFLLPKVKAICFDAEPVEAPVAVEPELDILEKTGLAEEPIC